VEPRPRRHRPGADDARRRPRGASRSSCRASTPPTGKVSYERRGVPVARVGDARHHGPRPDAGPVRRTPRGLPGEWPESYDDPRVPATPAWQEDHHRRPRGPGHPAGSRVGAERDRHRGSRHDPHGSGREPLVPLRPDLSRDLVLTTITGCQGRNGGGWAHYVGQEKIRPIMGFQHMAFALDWHRPPRHMNQTAYWYVNTSQYRYDTFDADDLDAGTGVFKGKTVMDLLAQSVRLGWSPSYPDLRPQQPAAGRRRSRGGHGVRGYVVEQLKPGALKFAVEDPERRRTTRGSCRCGAPTCSGPARRATSTSSSTCSAPTRCDRESRPARTSAPTDRRGPTRRPRASSTCS
jgi:nitrate reductase alpha subunit